MTAEPTFRVIQAPSPRPRRFHIAQPGPRARDASSRLDDVLQSQRGEAHDSHRQTRQRCDGSSEEYVDPGIA